jgi:hypothetical protein
MSIINRILSQILYRPDPSFGFTSQGTRIRRNSQVFGETWNTHLRKSQDTLASFLNNGSLKSLSICGAGSLLDVPHETLQKLDCPVYLQDADPGCINEWQKLTRSSTHPEHIHHCLLDITGLVLTWAKMLEVEKCHDLQELLDRLRLLGESECPECPFIRAQTTVSLNLLSQLPVYWQDYIYQSIRKKFGLSTLQNNEEEILSALYPSCTVLIRNHLRHLLPKKKNEKTLLITDLRYLYLPENIKPVIRKTEDGVFEIDYDESKNISKEQSVVEEQDALFSVSLEKWHKDLPQNITARVIDSWLWEIAHSRMKSTCHQVIAIEYKSSSTFPDSINQIVE